MPQTNARRKSSATPCHPNRKDTLILDFSYSWRERDVTGTVPCHNLKAAEALFGTLATPTTKWGLRHDIALIIRRLRTSRRQGACRSPHYDLREHHFLVREMRVLTRKLLTLNRI